MRTKICQLDGRTTSTLDSFYDQVSTQLGLPDYFGRNLDALWDVMTGDLKGPVEMIWERAELSRKEMGADYEKLIGVLREVEAARPDFRLKLK